LSASSEQAGLQDGGIEEEEREKREEGETRRNRWRFPFP
jgi:hypothetical protein